MRIYIKVTEATSTLAINFLLRNFLNKAIGIINFAKLFQNFIEDTMI